MEATRFPDPEEMNLELDATRRYRFAERLARGGATGQPKEETDRWVDVTILDERNALSRSAGSQGNKNPQENITN
jgi:hypothetical protein